MALKIPSRSMLKFCRAIDSESTCFIASCTFETGNWLSTARNSR